MECRHHRNVRSGQKEEKKKKVFGGGCQGEHRAAEVASAVEEPNVESLL
jgi:hypothetical protein